MSKQFIGVIVVVILLFVGIFALSGKKADKSSSSKSSSSTLTQHIQGKGTSGVTFTEYGDYQCPYCGQYYPTVKQVTTDLGDQIKFQFRNFPLVSIHQNAFAAARAAEAAGMQNKYFEMHDLLYETQNQWSTSTGASAVFDTYAQQLGLNVAQFKTDYASSKVNDLINADMAQGNKLGITGTPTFYLDGKQIQINNDPAAFEKLIKAEIAKKAPATSTDTKSGN